MKIDDEENAMGGISATFQGYNNAEAPAVCKWISKALVSQAECVNCQLS